MNLKLGKIISVCVIVVIALYACSDIKVDRIESAGSKNGSSEVWFKQAGVDLGYKIKMVSENSGFAISRGKGNDVKGKALLFKNGKWEAIDQYYYSDFPQIGFYNKDFWYVIHETHNGSYKPHLYSYNGNSKSEIFLPPVMWDNHDFNMWTGLGITPGGKAFLVGQLGNIIYYNGQKWSVVESPVKKKQNENYLSGDLDDVQMLTDTSGWAIGKQGIILKYTSGKWIKYPSPTEDELKSISMLNENFGWIVGDRGTILKYSNGIWKKDSTGIRISLNSVKVLDTNKAWIAAPRSTLFEYKNGKWVENTSIKIFEDSFNDLDVIKNSAGEYKIWVIGDNGIYSNSQNLKFSFTDITSQASLRKEGRTGLFCDFNGDHLPEVMQLLEDGPSILNENLGNNIFREVLRDYSEKKPVNDLTSNNSSQTIAVGDLNNDGYNDIIEILDDVNYKLSFGNGGFDFRNVNENEYLKFGFIQTDLSLASAQLADFDNDGNLDLFLSNYNYTDMLFKNDGTGHFKNVIDKSGIIKLINHRSYSVTLSDFNNDRLVDVLITYKVPEEKQNLFLYLNKGNFNFVPKPSSTFFTDIAPATLSSIAADFNNDGYSDILIFNNEEKLNFLINDGNANFNECVDSVGLNQKFFHPEPSDGIIGTADVNNDGWLDLFIGSKLFLCSPPAGSKKYQTYYEIGRHLGIDFLGNPTFADIDNDGDEDLFLGSSRAALGKGDRAVLYRNNLIDRNFLKVDLKPDISNRSGIGTEIFLEKYDRSGKIQYTQTKQIGLGQASISQSIDLPVNFGIDPNGKYKLKIVFPSGIVKEIENPLPNSLITVYESQFTDHLFALMQKSIGRTLLLINWPGETVKFLILLSILFLLYRYGIKTKAVKIIKRWYLAAAFVFLYILLVHFNITMNYVLSGVISIGFTSAMAVVLIFVSGRYIEKKESRYISHYKLVDIIGVGGMGKVFKAIDSHSGKTVAVKVLNPQVLKEEENKKRLASEGRLLSTFDHPNIVKVFEFGETSKHTFITMEYLSGGTLEEFIHKNYPLSSDQFINISSQICEGLSAIHSNDIVHRDLKSQNIMFGDDTQIRIMDFGLSKSPLVSTMTSLGTVVGTLGYVAPEQITNIKVDQRTDIFSLGVVLYQMLTNELPFKGENEMALIHSIFNTVPPKPSSINKLIDDKLNSIVEKCLSKDPDERYSDSKEVLKDLIKMKK